MTFVTLRVFTPQFYNTATLFDFVVEAITTLLLAFLKSFDEVFKAVVSIEFFLKNFLESLVDILFLKAFNTAISGFVEPNIIDDFFFADSVHGSIIENTMREHLKIVPVDFRLIVPNELPSPVEDPDQFFHFN